MKKPLLTSSHALALKAGTFVLAAMAAAYVLIPVGNVNAAALKQQGDAGSTFKSEAASSSTASTIKSVLSARVAGLPPIDEVRTSPVKGIYELRVGKQIFYADETGSYLINGSMLETGTQRNLTQERVTKLNAIDFSKLPLSDAVKIVRGDGSRKVVIFEDPNCGYCKRFEKEIKDVTNITIYTFLYPILGEDSMDKVRNIWCAKDKAKAWESWMLNAVATPSAAGDKSCNIDAITRTIKFGHDNGINGTPGLIFEDGTQSAGAMSLDAFNRRLLEASKNKAKAS